MKIYLIKPVLTGHSIPMTNFFARAYDNLIHKVKTKINLR